MMIIANRETYYGSREGQFFLSLPHQLRSTRAERCGGAIPLAETVRSAAEGQFRRRRRCGELRRGNSAGGDGAERCGEAIPQGCGGAILQAETVRRGNSEGEDCAEMQFSIGHFHEPLQLSPIIILERA